MLAIPLEKYYNTTQVIYLNREPLFDIPEKNLLMNCHISTVRIVIMAERNTDDPGKER